MTQGRLWQITEDALVGSDGQTLGSAGRPPGLLVWLGELTTQGPSSTANKAEVRLRLQSARPRPRACPTVASQTPARAQCHESVGSRLSPASHFFGYYDMPSWDISGRYLLTQRVNLDVQIPSADDAATIGIIDLDDFLPIPSRRHDARLVLAAGRHAALAARTRAKHDRL